MKIRNMLLKDIVGAAIVIAAGFLSGIIFHVVGSNKKMPAAAEEYLKNWDTFLVGYFITALFIAGIHVFNSARVRSKEKTLQENEKGTRGS